MHIKKTVLLLMFVFPGAIQAQRQDFKIDGTFAAPNIAGKVHYSYNENGISFKDSTTVSNGKFQFRGKVSGVQRAYFSFIPEGSAGTKHAWYDTKAIYLEQGSFQIAAGDSLSKAEIIGSALNTEYQRYMAPLNKLANERKPIYKEYMAISPEDRKASARAKELKIALDSCAAHREELLKAYVKSHPASYFSLEAIIELMGPYVAVEKVEKLWENIDPKLKNSYTGKIVGATLLGSKATNVGSRAPDFIQPDTAGKMVRLSEIKGKYVFVDFWASWCHPCRAENPNVLKAYQLYQNRNFTVVGISIDLEKDQEKWLKAIHEDGMPWTQLLSPANVDAGAKKSYGIRAIPSNFLIDPNGIIVAKNLRGEELHKKLAELLD